MHAGHPGHEEAAAHDFETWESLHRDLRGARRGGGVGLLIGTALGVAVGVLLSLCVTDAVQWLERLLNVRFLESDVYPISYLPSDLQWSDVAQIAVTALIISFFAALDPAWRASRVQPAEALRYE